MQQEIRLYYGRNVAWQCSDGVRWVDDAEVGVFHRL